MSAHFGLLAEQAGPAPASQFGLASQLGLSGQAGAGHPLVPSPQQQFGLAGEIGGSGDMPMLQQQQQQPVNLPPRQAYPDLGPGSTLQSAPQVDTGLAHTRDQQPTLRYGICSTLLTNLACTLLLANQCTILQQARRLVPLLTASSCCCYCCRSYCFCIHLVLPSTPAQGCPSRACSAQGAGRVHATAVPAAAPLCAALAAAAAAPAAPVAGAAATLWLSTAPPIAKGQHAPAAAAAAAAAAKWQGGWAHACFV